MLSFTWNAKADFVWPLQTRCLLKNRSSSKGVHVVCRRCDSYFVMGTVDTPPLLISGCLSSSHSGASSWSLLVVSIDVELKTTTRSSDQSVDHQRGLLSPPDLLKTTSVQVLHHSLSLVTADKGWLHGLLAILPLLFCGHHQQRDSALQPSNSIDSPSSFDLVHCQCQIIPPCVYTL